MTDGTPGMKDVAAVAGVSIGTVSNVLNRPHLVSEATRLRVQAAIVELGFVRNETARQLRAGSSRTIAYVVLDAANPFFNDVARGVEEIARGEGMVVYLCNSNQDGVREREYLERLREQRVQGVLITPIDPNGERLADLGMPVVLVDCHARDDRTCSVAVDDVLGGQLALEHLLETGHERIAFVGGPMNVQQVRDRNQGARDALAKWDGTAELVVLDTEALVVAEGRRAGERLVALPPEQRPTAAFCANDLLALGLLQAMTRFGLSVPGDLAVVGYDDIEFAEAAAVPLTSVRQPRELLGRTAARLLLEEASDEVHTHQQVRFRPELVVRASTRIQR
ncbi:LacI family DNA-binding transcriptional regulator [Actinophytocola oryzae]|uniref:LacI family transcriptional regulator n=1 Tax=Actinophytocola oryzae TaxID=502181 RepID=A0A4R7W4K1_9PSEU|nr:LacI family DNA-binding transcriptional regulator [Actinophytocola oryzae]TDV57135.1 LacI family transcriptional regulator [Actinophytocola oryzae]